MSEPSDIEILRRNAAQLRRQITRTQCWSLFYVLVTVVVALGSMAATFIALLTNPDASAFLAACVMGMAYVFIGGMRTKHNIVKVRVKMTLQVLESTVAELQKRQP